MNWHDSVKTDKQYEPRPRCFYCRKAIKKADLERVDMHPVHRVCLEMRKERDAAKERK